MRPHSLSLTFPAAGRRRRRGLLAAALLTAMIAAGPATAAHAGAVEPLSSDAAGKWAYLEFPTRAYAQPTAKSRALGRLRLTTQDRTDELLFAEARTLVHGAWWVRVRLPFRPTGTVGWVPESKLGPYQTVRSHLIIDRTTLRATLMHAGKIVFRARVGVGKRSTPTPRGEFYI